MEVPCRRLWRPVLPCIDTLTTSPSGPRERIPQTVFGPFLSTTFDSPDHAGCPQRPRGDRRSLAMRAGRFRSVRKIRQLTTFNDFGLAEPILRALAEEKYTTPTPIQTQAIPIVRDGHDLIGIAQTGTGKTAAFALPILNRLAANRKRPERKSCRVLVLSPTRELSAQILDSFQTYG